MNDAGHSDGDQVNGRKRRRVPPRLWPVIVAGLYAAIASVVARLEYVIEMAKISRGTFTDTFSPFAYTSLVTIPTSAVYSIWDGYPVEFDQERYRQLVKQAVSPIVISIAVQTCLLFALTYFAIRANRPNTRDREP